MSLLSLLASLRCRESAEAPMVLITPPRALMVQFMNSVKLSCLKLISFPVMVSGPEIHENEITHVFLSEFRVRSLFSPLIYSLCL